jgi:VanZ family protein
MHAPPAISMKRALLWLPAAAYLGLIFYLSSLPNPFALTGPPPAPDWALHMAEYAVLSALLLLALTGSFRVPPTFLKAGAVVAFCLAAGAADEVWQSYTPGRWATVSDAAADALGAVFGAALFALAASRLKKR